MVEWLEHLSANIYNNWKVELYKFYPLTEDKLKTENNLVGFTFFEDYKDNLGDDVEDVHVEQTVSISTGGIFETVLNLKEWIKQP